MRTARGTPVCNVGASMSRQWFPNVIFRTSACGSRTLRLNLALDNWEAAAGGTPATVLPRVRESTNLRPQAGRSILSSWQEGAPAGTAMTQRWEHHITI